MAAALIGLRLSAQQPSAATPAQGTPTFRAAARLVVQTVSVKDKDGRPVEGLTVKDFAITEDGEPQTVSFAEFQRLPVAPDNVNVVDRAGADSPPVAQAPMAPRAAATPTALASTTDTKIATSAPGDIRYRNRRLLVLYFDLTSMPSQDMLRAYNAARKFI